MQITHEDGILLAAVGVVSEIRVTDLRRPLKNTIFFSFSGAGCLAGDVAAYTLFLQLFIDLCCATGSTVSATGSWPMVTS